MVMDFSYTKELIDNCGSKTIEVVSPQSEILEIVRYCDNRICENPECQIHRRYKYLRTHRDQINAMDRNIKSPKAWIFTGWVFPYPIDRDFCRIKLRELYHILNSRIGSKTTFSIHMEVKLREDTWYLHFHVVSGGMVDFHFVKHLWGRHIRYEVAIHKHDLEMYISKYSTKTPKFISIYQQDEYFKFIYKTQLNRFSQGKSNKYSSGWHLYSALEYEAYCCEKKYHSGEHDYSPFIEAYEKNHPPH